jgi:hypothetical protein
VAKTLITDIDSTITDHWRRIRRYAQPYWPGLGIRPEAFERKAVLEDRMLPGCGETLWMLRRKGYEIGYLTARGWDRDGLVTKDQLNRFNLPDWNRVQIVRNLPEKLGVLSRAGCTYYVDDFMTGQEKAVGTFHRDIAQQIEQLGVHVIVFRNDWKDVVEQIRYYEEKRG